MTSVGSNVPSNIAPTTSESPVTKDEKGTATSNTSTSTSTSTSLSSDASKTTTSTGQNPNASPHPKPTLQGVYASFGGKANFLHSYGLKTWDSDDVEEGERIAQMMLEQDIQDWEDEQRELEQEQKNYDGGGEGDGRGDDVYDSFGGYENFMHSYGLKPWDMDDIEEGASIAEVLRANRQ